MTAPATPVFLPLPEPSRGWCARCDCWHLVRPEAAWPEALALMERLERWRRIDFDAAQGDPRCATAPLFAEEGGKMFGVLVCRDHRGRRVVLRAFSGRFGGLWQVTGWVGPVFDPFAFDRLNHAPEQMIKQLGVEIDQTAEPDQRRELVRRRRSLSRALMQAVHGLYRLANFRGEQRLLANVFLGDSRPPSGTGDCSAIKLLQHAALHGLRPEGLAEFFWGRPGSSAWREHSVCYPACPTRCMPVLGFMLCGLEAA